MSFMTPNVTFVIHSVTLLTPGIMFVTSGVVFCTPAVAKTCNRLSFLRPDCCKLKKSVNSFCGTSQFLDNPTATIDILTGSGNPIDSHLWILLTRV